MEAELRNTIGIAYDEMALIKPRYAPKLCACANFVETSTRRLRNRPNLPGPGPVKVGESGLVRSVAIRKQLHGDLHPDVAESLNLLGRILTRQADLAGARVIHEEALRVRRSLFGESHPAVADSLSNLAEVLRLSSDYAGAESMQRQALAIRKKLFGEFHPDVAQSLSRLAEVLRKRDDDAGAEAALREALALRTKLMGWEHPDVVQTLGSLADIFHREVFGGSPVCGVDPHRSPAEQSAPVSSEFVRAAWSVE